MKLNMHKIKLVGKMKLKFWVSLMLMTNILIAQTANKEVITFYKLLKAELGKIPIGPIEEHFDQGYFKVLTESEYFDSGIEVGLITLYKLCADKDESAAAQEIYNYFEQTKRLKKERKNMEAKMIVFDSMKQYLKIRVHPENLRAQYEKGGIVKTSYQGMIEVIVFDYPSGIGNVLKKYLDIWNKSQTEVYSVAKDNTLKHLTQKFEKVQPGKAGEEFYVLSNSSDLFITSSILDMNRLDMPLGRYGTLISIPNNTTIVALPLNENLKIEPFALSFVGLTDYLFQSKSAKPLSNNVFWFNKNESHLIKKDFAKNMLIYPNELQNIIKE